jgi:hypothetical protein
VKSKLSQDGTRTYRTAMLYFEDDTTSLEASISDEHEHLYKLMGDRLFPHGCGGLTACQ